MDMEEESVDREFQQKMTIVVEALKQAGYVPYDQLTGYIRTNNLSYITRQGHARELVSELDPAMIHRYLKKTINID